MKGVIPTYPPMYVETLKLTGHRDRRKLTFYFKAEKRVDFRELTKENFRIFKVSLPDLLDHYRCRVVDADLG